MGLSASQAKFLAITARKVDLEHRMQTICNRRIRLANEMDKVADKYNRAISDRKLFTSVGRGEVYEAISLENLHEQNFHVIDTATNEVLGAQLITDVYLIDSAAALVQALTTDFNGSKEYLLTGDLNLSAADNAALAGTVRDLTGGKFDGNGYTINGLTTMLFNSADATSTIEDMHLDGTSAYTATLTADNQALVVGNNAGTINNVGVGSNVTVDVAGNSNVGVIAGSNSGVIISSYSQGDIINADGTSTGSIAGVNSGTVSESYAGESVTITGTGSRMAAVVGYNTASGSVSESYSLATVNNTGSTSVTRDTGGVVGLNQGSVDTVFSYGSVTGYDAVGGVIGGQNGGTLTGSYSIANVSGNNEIGSLVGCQNAGGVVDASNFYVTDYTGVSSSVGANSATDNGVSLTSVELNWGKDPIPAFNSNSDWVARMNAGDYLTPTLSALPANINASQTTEVVPVTQVTSADTTATGVTVSIGGQTFNEVEYRDDQGVLVTAYEINNETQLDALAGVAGAVTQDFILMNDINMSGEWGIIDNFSGNFNGNMHTISNVSISTGDSNIGFIGTLAAGGRVENLTLDNTNISLTSSNTIDNVGTLVGYSQSGSSISNVKSLNLNMVINANGSSMYSADSIGGLIGESNSDVDRVEARGSLTLNNPNYQADEIGGLIGQNNTSNTKITRSVIDVDVNISGDVDCVSAVMACEGGNLIVENIAVLGQVRINGGLADSPSGPDSGITGHGSSTVIHSYRQYHTGDEISSDDVANYGVVGPQNANGDYHYDSNFIKYWNDSSGNPISTAITASSDTQQGSWDTDIWDTSSNPPTIKFSAMNTVEATYSTINSMTANNQGTNNDFVNAVDQIVPAAYDPDELFHVEYDFSAIDYDALGMDLEEGLRSGRYELVVDADLYTQDKTSAVGIGDVNYYERRDWRSTLIVQDDLDESNDFEAQTEYEFEVDRINNKDKNLELEQQKIETEYNAITTERDTIKKLIKTNSEKSFKIFG